MKEKSKIRGVLLSVLAAVIAFVIIVCIGMFGFYRFYIMPKYNNSDITQDGTRSELQGGDILSFAKFFSDRQFLDNLKNFDKSAAPDVISVLNELSEENPDTEDEDSNPKAQNPDVPKSTAEVKKAIEDAAEASDKKSAYERIIEAADKDEIMQGMAIAAKIDISVINKLQKDGKKAELKQYIKSVLTPSEISTGLRLYNKYKHLL